MGFYDDMRILQHKEELEKIEAGRWGDCIPIHVRIEPTEVCNFRCGFCWWHNDNKRKTLTSFNFTGRQVFNLDRLLAIIDEMADIGVKAWSFTGAGDPLMYPYILEVLKKVQDRGLIFGLTSNMAMPMSNEIINTLVKSSWLRWSMNAGTLDTYTSVHNPHGRDSRKIFLRVQENVRRIDRARRQKAKCPDFNASYVVSGNNSNDILPAAQLAKELGLDSISFRPDTPIKQCMKANVYSKDVVCKIKNAQKDIQNDHFNVYMDKVRQEDARKCSDPELVCFYSNHTTYLDAHGDIYPCCYTRYHSRYIIGNVMNQNFENFWFSSVRRKFYKKLIQDTCPSCPYIRFNQVLKPLYMGKGTTNDLFVQTKEKDCFI